MVHQIGWQTWLWIYGAILLLYVLCFALLNRVKDILKEELERSVNKIVGAQMMIAGKIDRSGNLTDGGVLPKGWPGTGGRPQ